MPVKTDLITFDITKRGRKFRGRERGFNPAIVAKIINSGSVQERVKNRDLYGYYGHWPRKALKKLDPTEGGIVNGKAIIIEPAFITTHLLAKPDGTIEHIAEFFDNAPGKAASGLMANRAGGFSAVMNEDEGKFHGFDYVLEPNFTGNRPYTMDSAIEEIGITYDEVAAYMEAADEVAAMSARWDAEKAALEAKIAKLTPATFDSVRGFNERNPRARALADADSFLTAPLGRREKQTDEKQKEIARARDLRTSRLVGL